MIPSAQVSSLTTGSITLPSARGAFVTGDFYSISSQTLSANQTTISFTDIPQTYKHLQFRIFQKSVDQGNNAVNTFFNNDTTLANYAYMLQGGDGGGGVAFRQVNGANAHMMSIRSGGWNTTVLNLYDYADSAVIKVRQSHSGSMATDQGSNFYYGGTWNNTAAVTRVDFTCATATNFLAGTVYALYGIKG